STETKVGRHRNARGRCELEQLRASDPLGRPGRTPRVGDLQCPVLDSDIDAARGSPLRPTVIEHENRHPEFKRPWPRSRTSRARKSSQIPRVAWPFEINRKILGAFAQSTDVTGCWAVRKRSAFGRKWRVQAKRHRDASPKGILEEGIQGFSDGSPDRCVFWEGDADGATALRFRPRGTRPRYSEGTFPASTPASRAGGSGGGRWW